MREFIKWLFENLLSSYFWEDGRVMIATIVIIGVSVELVMWKITKENQAKWQLFILSITCLMILIFGALIICFSNGTGGVTQHFYLGIFMYSLSLLAVTGIVGGIVFIFKIKNKKSYKQI